MRSIFTLLIFAIVGLSAIAQAAESEQALLLLKSDSYTDTQRTVEELQAAGCHARHVIPNKTIIADVPVEAESTIKALPNVLALYRDKVPSYAMTADSDLSTGISAWNALLAPVPPTPAGAAMPINDARVNTDTAGSITIDATSKAPGYYDTSNFMLGSVAVSVVLPESTGSAENWSNGSDRQNTVFNQIVKGMNQWVGICGSSNLTFYYEKHFSVSTSYEPIQNSNDSLWLNDVMSKLGYTSGTAISRTRAFDNDLRNRLKTDWAYTIFVADSWNDGDGCFPDGGFAYSQLFGPYLVMTYDNTSWGISNMYRIAAHESAHCFCAGDEYDTSGCSTSWYFGYLWVPNLNCENNNPNVVPCIMQHNAISNGVIVACQHSKYALGWRDSNGNGWYDPIDCAINNSFSLPPSPTNLIDITLTGTASFTPCPCAHPHESWGGPNTCTINKITGVYCWMDNGAYFSATPVDGAFNSDAEDYTYTLKNVPAGTHTIYTQVYGNFNKVSTPVSHTIIVGNPDPTPPIMGAVVDQGDAIYQDYTLSASWSATEPDSSIVEYQYAIGTTPADPDSGYIKGWTSTGTRPSVTLINLSLGEGQTYYFYVKACNSSLVWCRPAASDGVRVTLPSIAQAKCLAPGTEITLKDKIVTAVYGVRFYIQDGDNYSGIAVSWNSTSAVGNMVTVRGTIGKGDSSAIYERSVSASSVSTSSTGNNVPNPVCLLTRYAGGARLNEYTWGVANGCGANNVGLLARICGRVYAKYSGKFYVDDGCALAADGVNRGLRVESSKAVNVGDTVICTGIVGTYDPGTMGGALAVLKARDANDVRVIAP